MTGHHDDDARQREAKAILDRVRQETEPQVGAHTEAMLTRTREHFMAGDADQNDRLEVIGTRIGRMAGIVGFVVLSLLLASQLFGN
ncbi:MAG: hypothetical protein V7704_21625 [Aurantimonas endophytica]|jgi:hypothetical protein|uniref:Uncharacterized protein n=1 Tax=Aurantimonas endophytica TaxID=1522175 RepID=A0A7W6HGZ9_9HYPH|nr:hypothetical protein [Aurantimonas endophytica]MBB4005061.1 hypothetical protein [Aurantimonas endophytica]MCO6406273.1 hypothetical protein [Aurantimonas endophytica]